MRIIRDRRPIHVEDISGFVMVHMAKESWDRHERLSRLMGYRWIRRNGDTWDGKAAEPGDWFREAARFPKAGRIAVSKRMRTWLAGIRGQIMAETGDILWSLSAPRWWAIWNTIQEVFGREERVMQMEIPVR
jgi:hypothetical protein